MIKNLVVSGCSFTQTPVGYLNWSAYLRNTIPEVNYVNHGRSGAGNNYIADSMMKYLLKEKPDPQETLIMVMWTGVTRFDFNISKDYYNLLEGWINKEHNQDTHYVCSTGIGGLWPPVLKPLFSSLYKATDYKALASNTLFQMCSLKNFLENCGYRYKFMSYVNYWNQPKDWYSPNLDFSIGYYDGDDPLLSNLGNHWIWVNENKDCLYEFAKSRNMLQEDNFHPTPKAQELFFNEIIKPHIEGYLK
jgi:hypothetical protein